MLPLVTPILGFGSFCKTIEMQTRLYCIHLKSLLSEKCGLKLIDNLCYFSLDNGLWQNTCLSVHITHMARQTGKISDKLGLSPKNPVFRPKNWVYQLKNWVYREKLSFSTDKPSLSINWVYQLKNLVFQN